MQKQTETNPETETKAPPKPEPQELVKTRFVYGSSQDFKKVVKALQELIGDEVTFYVTMQGIRVLQLDPSRVALTELLMEKHVFEEYHCVQEGKFAFDLERLKDRTLKNVYKDETVEIVFNNGTAHVTLNADFKRHVDVTLLEPAEEESAKPVNVNYTAQAKLVTKTVQKIMKDVDAPLRFFATPDVLRMQERTDYEPFFVELKRGSDSLIDIEIREPADVTCSSSYFAAAVDALAPLTELLTLNLKTDMPLQLKCYALGKMPFTFWLAPKIYADEE